MYSCKWFPKKVPWDYILLLEAAAAGRALSTLICIYIHGSNNSKFLTGYIFCAFVYITKKN